MTLKGLQDGHRVSHIAIGIVLESRLVWSKVDPDQGDPGLRKIEFKDRRSDRCFTSFFSFLTLPHEFHGFVKALQCTYKYLFSEQWLVLNDVPPTTHILIYSTFIPAGIPGHLLMLRRPNFRILSVTIPAEGGGAFWISKFLAGFSVLIILPISCVSSSWSALVIHGGIIQTCNLSIKSHVSSKKLPSVIGTCKECSFRPHPWCPQASFWR